MAMLLSAILACATCVAAAGTFNEPPELALLQTILQVDEGAVEPVDDSTYDAPKAHAPKTNLIGCALIMGALAVIFFSCVHFHNTIVYLAAEDKKKTIQSKVEKLRKEKEAAGVITNEKQTEINAEGPGPAAGNRTNADSYDDDDDYETDFLPTAKKDNDMSWSTFMLGISFSMMCCFCTDQYVPHMPQMAEEMNVTQEQMAMTLQINWVLKGICCVIAGVLSDRVGRKPVMALAALLLAVSCWACAFTTNIYWFYLARGLQGIGEGAESVVRSCYRDKYSDMRARVRVGSAAMLIGMMAPAIAPSIGEEITERTGNWRVCFFVFGVICLFLVLAMWKLFDETMDVYNRPHTSIKDDVRMIFTDRHVVTILGLNSVMSSMGLIGAANAAFIFEQEYKLDPLLYARLSAVNAACMVLGIGLNRLMANTHPYVIMQRFFGAGYVGALMNIFFVLTGVMDNVWVYLTMSWSGAINTMPLVMNMGPVYMERMKNCSGLAGGVQVGVQNVVGSIISAMFTGIVAKYGVHGLMLCGAAFNCVSTAIFWIGIGLNPPDWLIKGMAKTPQLVEGPYFVSSKDAKKDKEAAKEATKEATK